MAATLDQSLGLNELIGLCLGCGKVIGAVKSGDISHFFLVAGCDGAKPGRNYYTEFVEKVPQDCVVLTLAMVLSWYEQKAVAILLTLLHLGIKGIRLGPSLLVFITPTVLGVLVDTFDIKPITTPDADLKAILG